MSLLRILVKSVTFILTMLCYFITSFTVYALFGFSFDRARPTLTKIIRLTSKVALVVFNIKIIKPELPKDLTSNYLIVSNHLTYLDIFIISDSFPSCFVTSKEMKETPFLGQVCLLAGCLFVERRKRSGITGEVNELARALINGLNVSIFPEATSTNGEAVIKFRRPLFQAAINSKADILPLCINYRRLDGEKLTLKNRDQVFWYDDTTFLKHVVRLFSHKSVLAELSVLPIIKTNSFEDKNALADATYAVIEKEYDKVIEAL